MIVEETKKKNRRKSFIPESQACKKYSEQLDYVWNLNENNFVQKQFGNNLIKTSKYSIWNFVPCDLFYQFSKVANLYFVMIAVLQTIKAISITNGLPTIIPSIIIIVLVSMIKDFLEELQRWKQDKKENERKVLQFLKGEFVERDGQHIHVGDLIKIKNDELVSADILIIETSDPKKGQCFIETKNLDGETNLNRKEINSNLKKIYQEEKLWGFQYLKKNSIQLKYEPANNFIHSFNGNLITQNNNVPLNNDNIILRGCTLKNTDYVIGIVLYAGHFTKIMQNAVASKNKRSNLEEKLNNYIIIIFLLQLCFCFTSSLIYVVWLSRVPFSSTYLELLQTSYVLTFFQRFGNWILIFGNFVPISLMVTLETVKYIQAQMIQKDQNLFDSRNIGCVVKSSNLNEELGQIKYVFSDKTGTLTQNKMVFKNLIVGNKAYEGGEKCGSAILSNQNINENIQNVDFNNNDFFNEIESNEQIQNVLRLLAICHQVMKYNGQYGASSPDELALVNFAKKSGFEFVEKDEDENLIILENSQEKKYKLLQIFEFSSKRKRMSVLVRDLQKNKIILYCKGADNVIMERSNQNMLSGNKNILQRQVDDYANQGLRTLLLAKKEISESELIDYQKQIQIAQQHIINRENEIEQIYEQIEQNLIILGASAIEDKLQDQVPETIEFMRQGGIKVWVLTGDKVETAKNIGFSCLLLTTQMELFEIVGEDFISIREILRKINKFFQKQTNKKEVGILITGAALVLINKDPKLKEQFIQVTLKSESVLCCRVSPKQKRDIVDMVHSALPKIRSLAIGDGANDVNMIVGANVGIGISGVEGQQAARAADYAIGEFKILKNLLFEYGREYY